MNIRKIVTILNYLSTRVSSPSKLKVVKLLYYIDKLHFSKYGRFVIGDEYVKLDFGPVPSLVLNVINDPRNALSESDYEYLTKYISFTGNKYKTVSSLRKPDLDELSKSEINVIDEVVKKFGRKSARDLVDLTHKEFAWINTAMYDPIKVENIIHNLPPKERSSILSRYQNDKEIEKCFAGV